MQSTIENKIRQAYAPDYLEIENESHKHSGNRTESHFRVLIVSDVFAPQKRVERQRHVFDLLSAEMKTIHALSLRLLSKEEWAAGQAEHFQSPNCQSKK